MIKNSTLMSGMLIFMGLYVTFAMGEYISGMILLGIGGLYNKE